MVLIINGQSQDLSVSTLDHVWAVYHPRDSQALEERAFVSDSGKGFAIALNGQVIPHAEWAFCALKSGDRIEIVQAVAGG